MIPANGLSAALRRPLRLWPGATLALLLCVVRFGLPLVAPDTIVYSLLGGMILGLAIVVWWVAFSRAPGIERIAAILLMPIGLYAAYRVVHVSIATGAMGMLFPFLAFPMLTVAFVAWASVSRGLSNRARLVSMAATIFLACGAWALVKTGGFDGDFRHDLAWRWSPTPEDRLLVQAAGEPLAPPPPAQQPAATVEVPPAQVPKDQPQAKAGSKPVDAPPPAPMADNYEWRGFRGPDRDGAVPGVRVLTDWSASPPVQIWRRPVGPGWSSFAVEGDLVYTQEQRGPDEVVSCYRLTTGKPVWLHRDAARFWESNAGAGPRATPELAHGRVYALGGTGLLNALDARDGSVVWSRNAAADTASKTPIWGFSGSPLAVDDMVIVAASGRLAAYDAATGNPRWLGPQGGDSYSSPHLATIGGVKQILLLNAAGVTSVSPSDGKVLWEHKWGGYPIVQPALTPENDILISMTESSGTRRLGILSGPGGWSAQERWTSNGLKPYFNDLVVHEGHAFGFDGAILSCIDLTDGKRKWKGGRYGHGQLVLLPDQDLLLVLSEEGELALVSASADGFKEVARSPAIQGKTWNHPVLARDVVLVRNSEQMAAFRIGLAPR